MQGLDWYGAFLGETRRIRINIACSDIDHGGDRDQRAGFCVWYLIQ